MFATVMAGSDVLPACGSDIVLALAARLRSAAHAHLDAIRDDNARRLDCAESNSLFSRFQRTSQNKSCLCRALCRDGSYSCGSRRDRPGLHSMSCLRLLDPVADDADGGDAFGLSHRPGPGRRNRSTRWIQVKNAPIENKCLQRIISLQGSWTGGTQLRRPPGLSIGQEQCNMLHIIPRRITV